MKNCDAMCDAHQISAPLHLWLRNKTFYSRIELPRINGKRRYKRVSLHTSNYYEARSMMAEQQELLNDIKELRQLYKQIDFEDSGFPYTPSPSQTTVFTPYLKTIPIVRKISSSNSNSLLSRVWSLFKKLQVYHLKKDYPIFHN